MNLNDIITKYSRPERETGRHASVESPRRRPFILVGRDAETLTEILKSLVPHGLVIRRRDS
jgi:hypothetical protein